ncbi:MAG: nucleotide exchange factor GrpE [Synergistaceae bacterium]|nr:nucleotide exchange factor GrpE [Synergistaceae bacterium]MBQ9594983.1 nucleotide exchange factor GrpE [Synergistaceae bacterium]MBR0204688.1 nucleotide exchange factor GrpE [Synergistaceae bacterium]
MDEELKQTQSQNEELQQEEEESHESELDEKIKGLEHDLAVSRADFYNYRQRAIKERNETRKRAAEDVIIAILPVLDNLDRALDAAHHGDANNILSGVEMVQRQFISVLEGLGVTAIKSQGEKFDPSLHDASGMESVDDPELDGKVITERLKGYRTSERVLRPSQVTVGKINR